MNEKKEIKIILNDNNSLSDKNTIIDNYNLLKFLPEKTKKSASTNLNKGEVSENSSSKSSFEYHYFFDDIIMNHLFKGNLSLTNYFNKSELPTNIITDMSYMFHKCSSLISLPDINKLNINNVTYMTNMFSECSSLISLPDLSKWNTQNLTKMDAMFYKCSSLEYLSGISK